MAASAASLTGTFYLKLRHRDCEMRAKRSKDGKVCIEFKFLDRISIRDYPETSLELSKDEALRLIHEMTGAMVAKD